jgi:kexin
MDVNGTFTGGTFIAPGGINSTITVTKEMLTERNFETLEHINVKVWINHTRRGDVEVKVTSPNNITSVLASRRLADGAETGFPGWIFMSVKHWYVSHSPYISLAHLNPTTGEKTQSATGQST